jgi:hypothetical protein
MIDLRKDSKYDVKGECPWIMLEKFALTVKHK